MARDTAQALARLAQEQGGYFTAKQATDAGYEYPQLVYHVKAGNFERVEHGLYRLPTVPPAEHDALIRLTLWSRNQKDEPQAVASHETALVLHELTELLPGRIHLTVPRSFRKPAPKGCVLHKGELAAHEVEERNGFKVTTPLRTLLDAASTGVSAEQLGKAVKEALARGQVRQAKLKEATRGRPEFERLTRTLDRRAAAK